MTLGLMAKTKKISQVQEHRHSGGSDRYSVLGEPESRLPSNEEKLASRREEKRNLVEQQYLIDVTASVPVAVPLLTHPDLLRYLGCLWVFFNLVDTGTCLKAQRECYGATAFSILEVPTCSCIRRGGDTPACNRYFFSCITCMILGL